MTDHTPGFGSAAKYVASTVREIAVDASVYDNKPSVTIVEIMGRHAGWLTAASALARMFKGDNPVLIYLPETAFHPETFLGQVRRALETTTNLVVCISEGIHDNTGTFICEYANDVGTDTFGHKMLTGSGKYLENLVKRNTRHQSALRGTQCFSTLLFCLSVPDRSPGGHSCRFLRRRACNGRSDRSDDYI